MLETATNVRELSFGDAIKEAIAEEMRRDPKVVLMGEDVAEAGTTFKVLTGLVDEFGKDRIIDTPISEAGFSGLGVGAAMAGMRPIVDIMFGDFLTIIMDQMVNQAAKIHYMSGGKWKVPMVFRLTMGATRRSAAQHSQSLHAWPSHIPGLKVVVPSTPYDAKGLFKAAVREDNPVVIFEHTISYRKVKGHVPDEDYIVPLGVADVKRQGSDITLIALSSMVQVALGAAKMLEEVGISAEVVDPRTTWPLDTKTLVESVKKTSRCIVIDAGYFHYGVTGEIASQVQDWERRIDFDRLRRERLNRIKGMLKKSELGSVLCFDMNNVRYITATHIGTWAQDKISRFTLLAQDAEPILWDFGSAARHHQQNCDWLGERSRAGIPLMRGAMTPEMGRSEEVARKIKRELEALGLHKEPVGVDVVEPPILFA